MPIINIEFRINAIKGVLENADQQALVAKELERTKGDWAAALPMIRSGLTAEAFAKAELAHSLAELSSDNAKLVHFVVNAPNVKNLYDAALKLNLNALAEQVDIKTATDEDKGESDEQTKLNLAKKLQDKLFAAEPLAKEMHLKIEARIGAMTEVLRNDKQIKLSELDEKLREANGDWKVVAEQLKETGSFPKINFAHTLAEITNDHLPLVEAISKNKTSTLRDVALNFNVEKIAKVVDTNSLPAEFKNGEPHIAAKIFAAKVNNELFNLVPTAVIQRMVREQEIPIADVGAREGVFKFLDNQPDFDLRTASVYKAFQHDKAFNAIADEQRTGVVEQLKVLARVQAYSPTPEVIPYMMKANLTSSFHVTEMGELTFLSAHGHGLGEAQARMVYTSALNKRIGNEQFLMSTREAVRGTGLAVIDGEQKMEARMMMMQAKVDEHAAPLNLEQLFGDMDFCECGECNSVYSPASYFVELLQYLRNNNLDPTKPNTGQKGIAGTPLEKLFRRRPDLGCLELTCENTNTVLPYIDLVNEVIESFVVHLGDYRASATTPRQAKLDVFNVEDETSSELLAQPQHTNYEAYCILKSAVYPFTLPYHQPIDATRIFLNYLGTSRAELLDTYRAACEVCTDPPLTAEQQKELETLHTVTLDRAVDAESLGMTQEEYIILTKEAFWPKRFFEITQNKTFTDDEYRQNIGVKPDEYYGYATEAEMLDLDETAKKGLTFVKKQFLPRTGIQYVDLVELLKAQFINPKFPQGKALTLLESIRFSYRFLHTLVDTSSNDPKVRFAKLVDFLEKAQPLVPLLDAMLHPDPCKEQKIDWCMETKELRNWVYCYFERIGKLLVLEAGEGPRLPIGGRILKRGENVVEEIGTLRVDGTIVDKAGAVIGNVNIAGQVIGTDGKPLVEKFGTNYLKIVAADGKFLGFINNQGLWGQRQDRLNWLPAQDTCDLDKVRLIHLDGTPVTSPEYDCIQRFIRLWRKMGWTIDETDKALIGLSGKKNGGSGDQADADCHYTGFESFADDCQPGGGNCEGENGEEDDCGCPDFPEFSCAITPVFLHQLVAVKKLLDLTGLPLPRLLTFWANISTAGEKSLYKRLFLTHNLLGIDKVFKADQHGNYLTQTATITDHLPVLMAALKLKADDIAAIKEFRKLSDQLTLANVSTLYQHSLLAKVLGVKMPELIEAIKLFGEPFGNAVKTFELFETWGKMEDAGFTFRQLNYIINDRDDVLRPLKPAKKKILQIAKTLFDGLNVIDRDHPDISVDKIDEITADTVRAKAGLIFEQAAVEQIVALLEGTSSYTTNAPASLTLTIPEALAKKLKYNNQKDAVPPRATIQVTGILTEAEKTNLKALSNNPDWPKAIDRVGKQTQNVFNNVLAGIFADQAAAKTKLLVGDVFPPEGNSAADKRLYFLQHFLPFLRQQLTHRFVIDTMANAVGLTNDITKAILSEVLKIGAGTNIQTTLAALEKIKEKPASSGSGWKGYLLPSGEAEYSFVAIGDTQPLALLLDGQIIPFPHQQEDPSDVWSTDKVKLKPGKLYWLEVADRPADKLQWKTATSPTANVPASALLPDFSTNSTEEIFIKLFKAGLIVHGFNLNADEITYLQVHGEEFDQLDFNALTLQHWKRMQAYVALRNSLPPRDVTLLDLFQWASEKPGDAAKLAAKIAALTEEIEKVTTWKKEKIKQLIASKHFDLENLDSFLNEMSLLKLQKALQVADKIGVDIDRLFEWAKPGSKFWECHKIAEDIRKAIRARFDQEDWEQVIRPLNNQLRENQKQALISYLLVQPDLIDWGVVDADSLFEFFLIDVQMSDCMETSRIKQAISTVQVFVQRCFLGLEEKYGVPNEVLDRERWEWMARYRIWEANRKVFLYPENWIEPQLRDDKSPFYKELESELLQKDINKQTVEDALKNYLFKVDEIANLKVVGLFLDQQGQKLHVFSRTRNAPYFFYYRYFHSEEKNWYPWEKMQVDVTSYDSEDPISGQIVYNGTYLTPMIWNNRLLVFFPQFAKKTRPISPRSSIDPRTSIPVGNPSMYWEIKMGWSEYRNGKWSQKQVTTEAIYTTSLPNIDLYVFIPKIGTDVNIDVYEGLRTIGKFHFTGSQLSKEPANTLYLGNLFGFHRAGNPPKIWSLQSTPTQHLPFFQTPPFFTDLSTTGEVRIPGSSQSIGFWHPFVHESLGKLLIGNLDSLFAYYLNRYTVGTFLQTDDTYGENRTSNAQKPQFHELKRPYSLYNWEAAFHAPMQLTERLLKAQQFDQALKMCHYVFNPMAKGADSSRFWQFPPFKEVDAENVLEKLFMGLQPGQPNDAINEWRDKPFQPHVIARSRPSAYMKWTVMKYIEILIAFGDYYFRQFTLESLPFAIQMYVMAAHLYGPHGQKIPKRGKIEPQTYNSLLDKWDAFGNAMVELELAFPFSNQTPLPIGVSNGVVGLANVFGFATSLYFCIPDNPKLRSLRDTIDDRLFKIRHCQDIEGVFRKLPLFEPPIDPALLVQAAAQGLSLSSVLNDLNSPMPNYRFYYLLQKALEICSELKSLGNTFLSVKEKMDGEVLAKMRATHESSLHNLVMEVKKLQLEESQKSVEALQQSRRGPVSRLQHYLKLIGQDLAKVPGDNTDFSEIPNQIEQPIDESGLKLIAFEKEEMDKAGAAADWQTGIGIVETLASIFHALPTMNAAVHPLGVGADVVWGFPNLANATSAVARGLRVYADHLSHQSSSAGKKGGFLRQLQDRVMQANTAGYEIKNIDKQILTQQIRINIANQEITNQQKQIDNSQEVEEFLRNKYTNQELYSWMEGQIRTLYYQAYTLAYDLAKRAEKVFRFERGLTNSNFIQFGYWDAGHDGLMAGERLYIGLKQLEAAHQENRGYDFEVMKHVSLRQINPLALLELRETGKCEFALPEVLFDMDYPGHYMRRIKSVALTVPCVVGPYTNLNCTLRLLENKFRLSSLAKNKNDYLEKTEETDERFTTVNVPITSIAASSGQNDSGVFELNFKDERYIPFEGAGAISKWRIELPSDFRQFDYDTITDVVLHVRYTSLDGGDKLKKPAAETVKDYIKKIDVLSQNEGLYAVFDLPHDFPSEWYQAMHPSTGATERVLELKDLSERLPIFTKGRKVQAKDVYLFPSIPAVPGDSLKAEDLRLRSKQNQNTDEFAFGDSPQGTMKTFSLKNVDIPMNDWELVFTAAAKQPEKLWMVVRYVLN
jgi:Tc toxin complex TcA C-terminal TcB-binding domain/Neuraminidase-like domain/Salmonella virulence plasmid 28.1kDa A protein